MSVIDASGENTALMSSSDPFYHFRESLEERINVLETSISSYLLLIKTTNTSTSSEYKQQKKNIKKLLKSAESTLKDLNATIRVVENDRSQFSHIDDEELEKRREFVTGISGKLYNLKSSTTSQQVQQKIKDDEIAHTRSQAGTMGATNRFEQENTDFVINQKANATVMMRQQDEALEDLDGAVDRVGNMAETINVELGVQNKMIDELGEDLDEAEARMGLVMGKLSKLLKTKDGCQLWTIISLTLVLLVLCFLVFYIP
ncbi:hypothetical protein TL16_g09093 [Triparma laevis f. inornata]|uniref:t-SNARE coiled-coil homology domain-containing protein n=2 Tax=Triparma laevis TaxID=1534972 RepID=A0A9W6ZXH5_9STRA|nr:hypothetical protein TrLO_g1495 [Triparma laevis f. longispina]GMH81931.1 hypothetical protein TL16_g09093 [Triparma laevis f. inornata]